MPTLDNIDNIDNLTNDNISDQKFSDVDDLRIQLIFNNVITNKVCTTYITEELMKIFPSGRFVNSDNTLTFLFYVNYNDDDLIACFFKKKIPVCIAPLINRIQIMGIGCEGTKTVVLKPSFARIEQQKSYCQHSIFIFQLLGDNPIVPSWTQWSKKILYGAIRSIATSFLFQPVIVNNSYKKESIDEWNASKTKFIVDCCTNKRVEDINKELEDNEPHEDECFHCVARELDSEEFYVIHIRCCYNQVWHAAMFTTLPSKVYAYITDQ